MENQSYDLEIELCGNCGRETAYFDEENSSDEREIYICTSCGCHYTYNDNLRIKMIKGTRRDWLDYMQKNLKFPFDGEIYEYQDRGPLQEGDKVIVTTVDHEDSDYGVIALIRAGRKKYYFPICDILAADKSSNNYQILEDYGTWFANCR